MPGRVRHAPLARTAGLLRLQSPTPALGEPGIPCPSIPSKSPVSTLPAIASAPCGFRRPLATSREVAGRRGERFAVRAWGEAQHPGGFDGVEVRQAAMLLTPLPPGAPAPALRLGVSCRICPVQACPARREASILG